MSESHWHVGWSYGDVDESFVTAFVDAFDYANAELGNAAERAYEDVTVYGEMGEFEEAYRHYKEGEVLAGLSANAQNIHRQGTLPAAERAPLYRDEPEQGPRWQTAAAHIMEQINAQGPGSFVIRQCTLPDCLKKG